LTSTLTAQRSIFSSVISCARVTTEHRSHCRQRGSLQLLKGLRNPEVLSIARPRRRASNEADKGFHFSRETPRRICLRFYLATTISLTPASISLLAREAPRQPHRPWPARSIDFAPAVTMLTPDGNDASASDRLDVACPSRKRVVEPFERNRDEYVSGRYNGTQLRREWRLSARLRVMDHSSRHRGKPRIAQHASQ
jgi:hypothetical protein